MLVHQPKVTLLADQEGYDDAVDHDGLRWDRRPAGSFGECQRTIWVEREAVPRW